MTIIFSWIDQQKLAMLMSGVITFFPMIMSALIAISIRYLYEWLKDVRKSNRAKKLLILEIKDNMSHLENAQLTLSRLGKSLNKPEITQEIFEEFKESQSREYRLSKEMLNEADRHLNLISLMVYKEIFLKLNRNFNSEQDEIIHRIYFHVLRIESYKTFLNDAKDKDSKHFYDVYFKISDLANLILELSKSSKIRKLDYSSKKSFLSVSHGSISSSSKLEQ